MRFQIRRTSDSQVLPHPRAYLDEENTKPHYKHYVIDISDLNDLLSLSKDVNEALVISADDFLVEGRPSIEIYDDYRE